MANSVKQQGHRDISRSNWERTSFEIVFPDTKEEALKVLQVYLTESFIAWANRPRGPRATLSNELNRSPQFRMRDGVDTQGRNVQILFGEATEAETKAAALELAVVYKRLLAEQERKPFKRSAQIQPLSYQWREWNEEDGEPYKVRTTFLCKEALAEVIRGWGYQGELLFREITYYLCRGLDKGPNGEYIPSFLGETHLEAVLSEIPDCLKAAEVEDPRTPRKDHLSVAAARFAADARAKGPIVVALYDHGKAQSRKCWGRVEK